MSNNTCVSFTKGYSFRAYLGQTYTNDEGQEVPIPPEEWDAFVLVIAATFPGGFTIYDATGGYQYQGTTFTEPTKVLEVIVPRKGSRDQVLAFSGLVNRYTEQFNQSSQLWTSNKVRYFSG